MILGAYSAQPGGGGQYLAHVVQVGIAAAGRREFAVTIHEEGTGLAFRQPVTVSEAVEARLLALVIDLHHWSAGVGLTEASARRALSELGRTLYRTFLGRRGGAALAALAPTAILWNVDDTLLGLPWEAIQSPSAELALEVPFGRIVSTATVPAARRDPVADDPVVRILAVVNPTEDLAATKAELNVLQALAGGAGPVEVRLDVLEGAAATRRGLASAVAAADHDIIHFAGHARFAEGRPDESALVLADGPLTAAAVTRLAWPAPPYLVVNSACQSARATEGQPLVSPSRRANGLPAAFLAAGCEAYVGHFWPIGDRAAGDFAAALYRTLFRDVNAGLAVLDGRRAVRALFDDGVELAAFGAVFFGDAGSEHDRRDLAKAV